MTDLEKLQHWINVAGCDRIGAQALPELKAAKAEIETLRCEIERLRKAAMQAADIIDQHLYSQCERDASAILRDAITGR